MQRPSLEAQLNKNLAVLNYENEAISFYFVYDGILNVTQADLDSCTNTLTKVII